jgi:hypothetical protein
MGSSDGFQFDRALQEYAVWQAVAAEVRSPAPSWWWSSALALRDDPRPLPPALADGLHRFGTTYRELARRMLEEIGAQTSKPWPDEFPTKYSSHGPEEAAASAEPAAQAASVAATPIS